MKKIEDFAEHEECPLVNGIIFPDGTIQLLDIEVDWAAPINYKIAVASKTSINLLEEKGELPWVSCTATVSLIDQQHSVEIIAGEAGYGSDGFVGVLDLHSKKLRWLAFFDCSNPFKQVEISGEELCATSTLGCVWRFKLDNPVDCIAECS